MSDHTLLPNAWYVNSNATYDNIRRNATVREAMISEWNTTKTGPLTWTIHDFVGFLRVPETDAIWKTNVDPSLGPTSAHFELLFVNAFMLPGRAMPSTGSYMSMFTNLM
jgi:hypothetical protein